MDQPVRLRRCEFSVLRAPWLVALAVALVAGGCQSGDDGAGFWHRLLGGASEAPAEEVRDTHGPMRFELDHPLSVQLLNLDSDEWERLAEGARQGVMELAPVVLPEGDALAPYGNHHFGWPVAAQVGDTVIVVYTRYLANWGDETRNEFSSAAMVTRSHDGGKTWSQPMDLDGARQRRTNPLAVGRNQFGSALCAMADGRLVLLCSWGVFVSEDAGRRWRHLPDAFSSDQLQGAGTNTGPNMVEHHDYGLISFGHSVEPFPTDEIWMRYSSNGGKNWAESAPVLPTHAVVVEPASLLLGDRLFILSRNHGGYDRATQTWRYVQIAADDIASTWSAQLTNIRASDARHWEGGSRHPSFGPWAQDTPDIAFNPVTGRIEAAVTNRLGGGPGRLDQHTHMTLCLWSIDPDDMIAGQAEWQFEGELLRARGTFVSDPPRDGMHPGGGVIDADRGVQHLFIYLGNTSGPAGIFRITRTLDTPRLARWLKGESE